MLIVGAKVVGDAVGAVFLVTKDKSCWSACTFGGLIGVAAAAYWFGGCIAHCVGACSSCL